MRAETNTSILGLLSREDGMLLKADVPARSVDHTWLQKVYGGSRIQCQSINSQFAFGNQCLNTYTYT